MALSNKQVREILSEAGVAEDKMGAAVTAIIAGHTASIEALREQRDEYKAKADEKETVDTENAKLKEQLKGYEGKDYDALKKEFDDYKQGIANKETRAKKEAAYAKILKDAGIPEKHYAFVTKYSDIDSMEIDENGDFVDAKGILENVKKEFCDHIQTVKVEGAKTPTPPENVGGKAAKTKDEIMAIKDTAERQKAWGEYLKARPQ